MCESRNCCCSCCPVPNWLHTTKYVEFQMRHSRSHIQLSQQESARERERKHERAPLCERACVRERVYARARRSLCWPRCLRHTAANANVSTHHWQATSPSTTTTTHGLGGTAESAPASIALPGTQRLRLRNSTLAGTRRTIKSSISCRRSPCHVKCETFWCRTRHKVLDSFIFLAASDSGGT